MEIEILNTVKTPQVILGLLVIALFAWFRFNTWTDREREEGHGTDNPPRVYTTWVRYVSCALVYVLSLEVVYFGFVVIPDLLPILAKGLSIKLPEEAFADTRNFPLWVLVIIIGLLPHAPGFKNLEEWWRYSVHRRAFIPAEAQALVQQIAVSQEIFRPNHEQAAKVLETLTEELPPQVNAMDPRNAVAYRWFKLSYLRKKIQEWQCQPEVNRFFSACRREYALCDENYIRLRTDVKLYLDREATLAGRPSSARDRDYQNARRKVILEGVDKLLLRTYEFISCGILATERSAKNRHRAFQHFDLYAKFTTTIPVLWDVILECAIAVFAITMITTLAYFFLQKTTPTLLGRALIWSTGSLALQALGIFGSVLFYRFVCQKMRRATDLTVCGPLVHVSLATLVGYVIGCLVLVAFLYLSAGRLPAEKYRAIVLSWALIPSATSGFIVSYLFGLRPARWWWSEGVLQALGMAVVALVSYTLVTEALGFPWRARFAIYAIGTCGLSGLAIGLIFPGQYRRYSATAYHGPERRSYPRQLSGVMSSFRVGTAQWACETVDISLGGARTTANVSNDIGTAAILELPGIGALQGVISRKAEGMTCVRFMLDEAMRNSLSSYLAHRG